MSTWLRLYAQVRSNVARPHGAEVPIAKATIKNAISYYPKRDIQRSKARGARGLAAPDQPQPASDDAVIHGTWLVTAAMGETEEASEADDRGRTAVQGAFGPRSPPAPTSTLVEVDVRDAEQRREINAPDFEELGNRYASRSVIIIRKCVLSTIGYDNSRQMAASTRVYRCEGLRGSDKGYAAPPMLRGNTDISDAVWHCATANRELEVVRAPNYETMLEPFEDALLDGPP